MTIQIDLWQLVGAATGMLVFFGGMAVGLFERLLKRAEKSLENHISALEGRFVEVKDLTQRGVDKADQLEKDFLRFQADLPLNYVRREDYVRGQSVIEAKLDALYTMLNAQANIHAREGKHHA